jgi:hypothetical protein
MPAAKVAKGFMEIMENENRIIGPIKHEIWHSGFEHAGVIVICKSRIVDHCAANWPIYIPMIDQIVRDAYEICDPVSEWFQKASTIKSCREYEDRIRMTPAAQVIKREYDYATYDEISFFIYTPRDMSTFDAALSGARRKFKELSLEMYDALGLSAPAFLDEPYYNASRESTLPAA